MTVTVILIYDWCSDRLWIQTVIGYKHMVGRVFFLESMKKKVIEINSATEGLNATKVAESHSLPSTRKKGLADLKQLLKPAKHMHVKSFLKMKLNKSLIFISRKRSRCARRRLKLLRKNLFLY